MRASPSRPRLSGVPSRVGITRQSLVPDFKRLIEDPLEKRTVGGDKFHRVGWMVMSSEWNREVD
jgi:hypothetical protein